MGVKITMFLAVGTVALWLFGMFTSDHEVKLLLWSWCAGWGVGKAIGDILKLIQAEDKHG